MTINGRHHAQRFGIADTPSQMHFVTLMWKLGAGFFPHNGFKQIADDPDLNGPQKIDAFYEVPDDQAVAAIMAPDDRWWYPEAMGAAEALQCAAI